MSIWKLRNVKANFDLLIKELNITPTFATVLANRNILTKRLLQTYKNTDEKFLYEVELMKDCQKAYEILKNAIENKIKICIYGDYDVDGVTSTVILFKALKSIGANVFYYIPDREKEGYGLNKKSVENVVEKGAQFILTCDNGIASIEEVDYIKSLNLEIVILDHHEPKFKIENEQKEEVLPLADAILNPKQLECKYPFKLLCAGGISYKFIKSFFNYLNVSKNTDEYLVFASIATICDVVDLIDENRIIVKKGLEIINQNKSINKGLYELIKLNNIQDKIIDEQDYGFKIGPCINASGRLETALKAVELFTCENDGEVTKIAEEIIDLNNERKKLTSLAVEEIHFYIENSDIKNDKVLVIYNDKIHESIAGIVAGRIKEIYNKPTFVITNSNDMAKGSGRSIECYNMFEEMVKCEHFFTKYGGHKMAAGFSLKHEYIEDFRKEINKNCNLNKNQLTRTIIIDKVIKISDINTKLLQELHTMKPFGKENKEPIFATKNLKINKIKLVGKEKKCLSFKLEDDEGNKIDAIDFSLYNKFIEILTKQNLNEDFDDVILGKSQTINLKMDFVYSVGVNSFNNNVNLLIKDFRNSEGI